MGLLRQGVLPRDFIDSEQLIKILKEFKERLPEDSKLAFEESEIEMYYTYPFSTFSYSDNKKFIEINLPIIKKEKK